MKTETEKKDVLLGLLRDVYYQYISMADPNGPERIQKKACANMVEKIRETAKEINELENIS